MLRIHFTPEDLTRTRLSPAPHPMWEMLLSLYRLRRRDNLLFEGWRRSAARTAPASTRLLTDLVPMTGYAADFLTPMTEEFSLTEGLAALRRTSRQRLRTDLSILGGTQTLPLWTAELAEGHSEPLHRLADAAAQYFVACVAPYWTTVRDNIDRERARQAKMLADGGYELVLQQLHPTACWRFPVLELDFPVDHEMHLDGRGLQLVPSFFCQGPPTTFLDNAFDPVLVYPVRHDDLTWPVRHSIRQSLASLLGRTRAKVLEAIGERTSTTGEVARRTGTTLPAADRLAAALRAAGLVASVQNGQSMSHSITPVGRALLEGGNT